MPDGLMARGGSLCVRVGGASGAVGVWDDQSLSVNMGR